MTDDQKPLGSGFDARSTAAEVLAGRDLTGRYVLVTGGHSGLGLETTRALAEAGAAVLVGARAFRSLWVRVRVLGVARACVKPRHT